MLTENTSRMLTQAIRLLRSIRWFGGELARARVVVCGVGPLESGARGTLEALGAEIRTVSRFHAANPTANRHQLIAELLEAPEEVLFLLDCDTIVVRDPLPYLNADAFQAKIAPTPTVSDEVFERLFAHFKLPKPPVRIRRRRRGSRCFTIACVPRDSFRSRRQLDDFDSLLRAVFESRSWRVGHGLTGLLRLLRKSDALSAVDRWREMRRRRPV